jgi:hypothetical protein
MHAQHCTYFDKFSCPCYFLPFDAGNRGHCVIFYFLLFDVSQMLHAAIKPRAIEQEKSVIEHFSTRDVGSFP